MYSGVMLTRNAGKLMGAHQKIDRVARRHLAELLVPSTNFPKIKSIIHFEGKNGPDAIKVKSPAKDEPWHYFDPLSGDSKAFMSIIGVHYEALVRELVANNKERASFEAAWLAHAVVDGLTPAHHYPFTEKIAELRGGASNSSRTTYKKKLFFGGNNKRETLKNMMKAYGPKGIYVAHVLFEAGFTVIIRPLRFPDARPNPQDVALAKELGYSEYYLRQAKNVAKQAMFDSYLKDGWTGRLSRQVREELAPTIVRTVTVMWYLAVQESEQQRKLLK